MRILWLCNIMLPRVAEQLHIEASNKEGWLTGLSEKLLADADESIDLAVCFPTDETLDGLAEKIVVENKNNTRYLYAFGFYEDTKNPHIYDAGLESRLAKIVQTYKPDIVHIFGTEYPHTLAMTRAFHRPERTLIGIQGLCGECSKYYMVDIPEAVQKRKTFRDIVRKDSVMQQYQKFMMRGEHEVEAIRNVNHITGRTDWDKELTHAYNPYAKYYFMNETLRANFYEGNWDSNICEPHSIFVSQGDYPIKGLHYILSIMPELIKQYPDSKLYVAGNSISAYRTWKEKLKISSYGKYIHDLINENNLQEHVVFLGRLSAEEMKKQYLSSSVFLCSSSIENSPNSIGEAMLLGVPVISARTGGIESIFHGERVDDSHVKHDIETSDGILYENGNMQELKEALLSLWSDKKRAEQYGQNAKAHATLTHDAEKNYQRLLEIYKEIAATTRTVTFVSNYINHHQIPFSNAMYKEYGDNYHFIQTEPMEEERVKLGWNAEDVPVYVKKYYEEPEVCQQMIDQSDVVIWGGVDDETNIKARLNNGKFTIRYNERLYKTGRWKAISPRGLKKKHADHTAYADKPVYLLCAGAYVAGDFDIVKAYPGKKMRWGYFPELKEYDIDKLMAGKYRHTEEARKDGSISILWAARFIDWKHPEVILQVAQNLKKAGYKFKITMIGDGILLEKIKENTEAKQITDVIEFTGAMKPTDVRKKMEKADVYLATSDYQEGWGAVLNEAMNSGCAVIANQAMGAAPYLIQNGGNGLLYQNGRIQQLESFIAELFQNKDFIDKLGTKAYETIQTKWNATEATKRLCEFMDYGTIYEQGPCSKED